MANKLISDLSSAAILVTDLLEHQPIAGPPSKKGTVTALFTGVDGALAIDRDARQLFDNGPVKTLDWNVGQLFSSGLVSLDWTLRKLVDTNGISSGLWEDRQFNDGAGVLSADWGNRQLVQSSTAVWLDYEQQTIEMIKDGGGSDSLDSGTRQLFAADGTTLVLDWSTQQTSSGPQTAGALYTATEQTMLQEAYDALRAYGLLS